MSSGEDKSDDDLSFEEQSRLLRKKHGLRTGGIPKTTEQNVGHKLGKEIEKAGQPIDQSLLDRRLQETLNRESGRSLFELSLLSAIRGHTGEPDNADKYPSPVEKGEPGGEQNSKDSLAGDRISSEGTDACQNGETVASPRSSSVEEGAAISGFPNFQSAGEGENFLPPLESACEAVLESDVSELPAEESEEQACFEEISEYFVSLAEEFKQESGLDMVFSADTVGLFMNCSGKSEHVYSFENSPDAAESARFFVRSLTEKYLERICASFRIEFGSPGELAVRQLQDNDNNELVHGEKLFVRIPRLDELQALQRAVEFSWPAVYQGSDQLALRVLFLNGTLVKDEADGVLLKFLEDGRPLLFVTPELSRAGAATEYDRSSEDQQDSWQAAIMRELAWKTLVDSRAFPLSGSLIEMLGWFRLSADDKKSVFALKTSEGSLYLPYEDASDPGQAWFKCGENGSPELAGSGDAEGISGMIFLNNEQMSERVAVKHAGKTCFSPEEQLADALRCLWQGCDARRELAERSPALYRAVREIDQKSINRAYPAQNGEPSMLRAPSGALVDNTIENRQEVMRFEEACLTQ